MEIEFLKLFVVVVDTVDPVVAFAKAAAVPWLFASLVVVVSHEYSDRIASSMLLLVVVDVEAAEICAAS